LPLKISFLLVLLRLLRLLPLNTLSWPAVAAGREREQEATGAVQAVLVAF
jgi:hypothetical protein